MTNDSSYQVVNQDQVMVLTAQGCTAQDWKQIFVADGFDPACMRGVDFFGKVKLGKLVGEIKDAGSPAKPCGIYNAVIVNCTVGDGTRIANTGVHIANYDIADNVCIENVALMQTNPGAMFGNGIEVDVVNEGGGREVILFNELSAQLAYIMCLHRYRPVLIDKLKAMAGKYVESVQSDRGKVGAGAKVCSAGEIIDVNIGPYATVNGAASLKNGTVLS